MIIKCPNCGSSKIEFHEVTGEWECPKCGYEELCIRLRGMKYILPGGLFLTSLALVYGGSHWFYSGSVRHCFYKRTEHGEVTFDYEKGEIIDREQKIGELVIHVHGTVPKIRFDEAVAEFLNHVHEKYPTVGVLVGEGKHGG